MAINFLALGEIIAKLGTIKNVRNNIPCTL